MSDNQRQSADPANDNIKDRTKPSTEEADRGIRARYAGLREPREWGSGFPILRLHFNDAAQEGGARANDESREQSRLTRAFNRVAPSASRAEKPEPSLDLEPPRIGLGSFGAQKQPKHNLVLKRVQAMRDAFNRAAEGEPDNSNGRGR